METARRTSAIALERWLSDSVGFRRTEISAQPVRIDDVVAVGATRRRFEHGRQVQVRHTELREVGHQVSGVREAEARAELQAVGADELAVHQPTIATEWGGTIT